MTGIYFGGGQVISRINLSGYQPVDTNGYAAASMCPVQVYWGRLAAVQRPTAPDDCGAGEPGTLGAIALLNFVYDVFLAFHSTKKL